MADPRATPCTSCQKPIVFLTTLKGNKMPVDAETVEPADQVLDLTRHKSHFATCTNPAKHRKRK
jgi:hypothetical protein